MFDVKLCYCIPPGLALLTMDDENPCRWPECPNGDKPDPNELLSED